MNTKSINIYITSLGLVNALGFNKQEVLDNLLKGISPGMQHYQAPIIKKQHYCGIINNPLPDIPKHLADFNCRNNQLALAAVEQIKGDIKIIIERYGAARVGLIIGSSTSGISEAEQALKDKQETGSFPSEYHYKMQEVGTAAEFLGAYLELEGPCYLISTACSSSGKVFSAAKRLLEQDHCDAVIVGGADSLCDLTLGGFDSLEAISSEKSLPFSKNRKGINIGEAAAIFILTKESIFKDSYGANILLMGVGETSDAHHMSAPEPNGEGAKRSMLSALENANMKAKDIDYINLHGTGTQLNDRMEATAVQAVFGDKILCSSTKQLTGHTLGAAGATETALCWLLLSSQQPSYLPVHLYDEHYDPEIAKINLVTKSHELKSITATISNSFAFGGNNVSVIIGAQKEKH